MPKPAQKKSNRSIPKPNVAELRRRGALSVTDWITAAEDLLAENNVSSVDIPNLCSRLGVTKGSFYWHFGGRGDLLSTIIDEWRKRTTLDVNDRAAHLRSSPASALRYVLAAICKPSPNRNSAIERSLRDWARTDQAARAAVEQVDQIRLSFLQDLFRQLDCSAKEARIRAYAAYSIMMGDSILRETVAPDYDVRDYINRFAELLLSPSRKIEGDGTEDYNDRQRQIRA